MHQQIILASSSTARIEYLNQENLDYVIQPHTLDESIKKKKIPFENMVEQLAEMKARSIGERVIKL